MINTRNEARKGIDAAGITCENVTESQLYLLWICLSNCMDFSECYKGTMRMNNPSSKFMECRTDKWEAREAISFNRDGFIGIAGWADSNNVKPFLDGIDQWLRILNPPTGDDRL